MIFLGISGYVFGTLYMFLTQFGIWWFLNYATGMVTSICLLTYYVRHRGDPDPNPNSNPNPNPNPSAMSDPQSTDQNLETENE
jgi:hypothetical protein